MRTATISLAMMLGLAACVSPETSSSPAKSETPGALQPVQTTRAVQLFDTVCGSTLSANFAGAKSAMARVGVTQPSPLGTSTMYSQTEDVSFQIVEGPGLGKTCSMVFGTTQRESAVMAELGNIGPIMQTPMGKAALYRGKKSLMLVSGGDKRVGNTTYFNLRLLSER